MQPRSLFEKVWDAHLVSGETENKPAVLYIDLHLIHEVTSPQAFDVLRRRNLPVRNPGRVLATMDHSTPTTRRDAEGNHEFVSESARQQVAQLRKNCSDFGIHLHDWDSPNRGIVHVIGPELGATQPGKTIVCGDSHTSTHGAFGALAFGIGSTEVSHVLATQCLLQRKPKSMRIMVQGTLGFGVSAKDLVLAVIARIGVNGGTGYVIEFAGPAIRALSMEERMTVCNMAIEAGARAGMIAPDEKTLDYVQGRQMAPTANDWPESTRKWLALASDADAKFDKEVELDAGQITPTITYGTHPGMAIPVDGRVPRALTEVDRKACSYMLVVPEETMLGTPVDVVFIGSCTNSRLSDLEVVAAVLTERRVAAHVRMLVVPGSEQVKQQAEAKGLNRIFLAAGAEWREPGCSMCIAMNGDLARPGQLVVSTSNRNFEGRQGKGARTVLASPATAAASAIAGVLADPRDYLLREAV